MVATRSRRSPLAITLGIWKALFLREAVVRLSRDRFGWALVLLEPVAHVGVLMALFVVGFRQRELAGGDVSIFILLGVTGFFVVRNMLNGAITVIEASESLFTYRRVRPIDVVVARVGLETLLAILVFALGCAIATFLGYRALPADPLHALQALGALWFAGFGLALVVSVAARLVVLARLMRRALVLLYLLSAVMFPSIIVPRGVREWLLLNPFVHGLEALRVAFMPGYRIPAGIDLAYPLQFGVVCLFLGLALHLRYEDALMAER